ncbi:uncharacterized protein LOC129752760 [Uranotaenia lowii]|uniref:uncharacterized protein LOC129752760 n=1 Tax=Uranotaenia lowii TaxID=190385 RepID=UPI002478D70D|nr:uncharacterized protein LOC129752760 [Uranotaenia lowii]
MSNLRARAQPTEQDLRNEKQALLGIKLLEAVCKLFVVIQSFRLNVEASCVFSLVFVARRFFGDRIGSLACIPVHILAVLNEIGPLPNDVFLYVIYVGYFFSSFGWFLLNIFTKSKIIYTWEAAYALSGFVAFAACGFIDMYMVEKDVHLPYLTDKQEWYHKYFEYSRIESILSMQTSGLFLIHGIFMLDILGVLEKFEGDGYPGSHATIESKDADAYRRLRLKPFWIPLFGWICRMCLSKCCRSNARH